MPDRKIIASLATSADGFIARGDGSFDWLDRPQPPDHYGMGEFVKTIDTIIWGRKTYDQSLGYGGAGGFGKKIKNYVFTTREGEPAKNVEFVSGPIIDFVTNLRESPGKNIWMMGGGLIIGSFLDAGAIDEFIIHVIPTFIGEGIPLLGPKRRTVQLELVTSHAYPDGVVKLHYKLKQTE